MSSSVYRSNEFRVKPQDKVVIDIREKAERLISENIEKERLREQKRKAAAALAEAPDTGEFGDGEDGFVEGIPGVREILTDDPDAMPEEGGFPKEEGAVPDAAVLEQASEEADRIISEARDEAERILEEARNEAEGVKASIFEEARERGYEQGTEDARGETEQIRNEYEEKVTALENEYNKMLLEAEPRMVEVITSVYEKVFSIDLDNYGQILLQLLRTAMRDSENSRNFIIHVSDHDKDAVSEERESLREAAGDSSTMDIILDTTLSPGQALIENDDGIIDCSVDTELKELTSRIRLLSGI
ncbi:MAG: hypothetical protein K6E33_04280 [Lachnospiraceae bacterium]|nr:hypothetical protein [Lachnospiraceae bacterium]